jgi:guanylate kinase
MKHNRRGRVFIISAPSGTGKSTVIKKLMETRSDLYFSVSATTRSARPGELDGVSYQFMSHEQFQDLLQRNEFLEHAEYVGNYYGTPKAPVLEHIERGNDIILDIDVQGCKQVKAAMPEAVTIFIIPPSLEELERRLRYRNTDSEDRIVKRLERAITELGEKDTYDHVVVNDSVDQAAQEILQIMARA